MKNSIGQSVVLTLFGESHGEAIGATLDGLAPGISVDEAVIARAMERRKGLDGISTPRKEADCVTILSGVFEGKTTGTPICFMIHNETMRSGDYGRTKELARPSHADLAAEYKYHGFQDYRGGGHFSGRLTAAIVAAGSLVRSALEAKGVYVATHIGSCGGYTDRALDPTRMKEEVRLLESKPLSVLDPEAEAGMRSAMQAVAREGDSIGGILQSAIVGMPVGVGEPWFDTVEGQLAYAMLSIPAVKGVDFGSGFALADMKGSEANDSWRHRQGGVFTETNHSGGINGGITNGMPITFRTVVKPTASIFQPQKTINIKTGEEADLTIRGRHDPAIISRASVVVDSMAALVCADMLALRFGTDYLA